MADFPRRMRDWLFNVMRDLADRQELSPYYLKMQREAETNLTRRWTNAAIWKWCDLDGHPHDKYAKMVITFKFILISHLLADNNRTIPLRRGSTVTRVLGEYSLVFLLDFRFLWVKT